MALERVIHLTTAATEALIMNADVRAGVPFIQNAYNKWFSAKNKRSCCRNSIDISSREFIVRSVRHTILSLPPDKLQIVKQVLHADQLIIHLEDGGTGRGVGGISVKRIIR